MAKVPRIIQSVIRAWDVSSLKRSAQYNPALNYTRLEVFSEKEKETAEGKSSSPLAERGFIHVPAPGAHGGVIARGPIRRDVTINLIALRRLGGPERDILRQYILGLTLIAATEPIDPFLRQGCLLTPDPDAPAHWQVVGRNGVRADVELSNKSVLTYATRAAAAFRVGPDCEVAFDKALAKADAKAKAKK